MIIEEKKIDNKYLGLTQKELDEAYENFQKIRYNANKRHRVNDNKPVESLQFQYPIIRRFVKLLSK